MNETFERVSQKLRLAAVMSTLCLLLMTQLVKAHEVTPSIADFSVAQGQVTLDIRLNIEAFVAGIDLDGMEDTDVSDRSERYDILRAMSQEEIEPLVREFADSWINQISVTAGGPVDLVVERIFVPDVGDVELPRASHLILGGKIRPGANTVTFGWPKGAGDLVLRQQGVQDPFTGYLTGGEFSPGIPISGGVTATGWQVLAEYVPVGFDHILPKGLDHILFVLGLFFLSTRLRPLIWQISAFTLAHTVTLAMGALGWVQVSPAIVEPLIAASIVYVAVENLFTDGLNPWRPVVIFCFGLLHGLGFASVLEAFGLPAGQFVPALIGFNIGVEIGQLTVIAIAFVTVGYWFRNKPWYRSRISMPASVAIAVVGAYWFIERVI